MSARVTLAGRIAVFAVALVSVLNALARPGTREFFMRSAPAVAEAALALLVVTVAGGLALFALKWLVARDIG